MRRVLREPIVQFLIGGSIVFGVLSFLTGDSALPPAAPGPAADSRRIVTEREALLDFVQAKTKISVAADVLRAFEAFDADQRQEWIDRYVRQEALVREARSLGLDREDELIRRRLVQKIEFLTLGLFEDELRLDQVELEAFYHQRGEDYRIPTILTLTHVYIKARDNELATGLSRPTLGSSKSSEFRRAEALLVTLNEQKRSFRGSAGLGDRFLYNRNYVDRTSDEIRSHFGAEIADAMEQIEPHASNWRGPYASAYGWHLVLLTGRRDSRVPALSEIAPMLRDDALREKREILLDEAIAAVISQYRVNQTAIDDW
jgi:peptidyl-prolyl cis-trans isomerase C